MTDFNYSREKGKKRPFSGALERVISGAQTGVDRAALDAAVASGVPIGGWCPRGRRAEDGRIPEKYPLTETPSIDYSERTRKNVEEADGTLILGTSPLRGGSLLTAECAKELGKPHLLLLPFEQSLETMQVEARKWIGREEISVLNVAGPRESQAPGIYEKCFDFLASLFQAVNEKK